MLQRTPLPRGHAYRPDGVTFCAAKRTALSFCLADPTWRSAAPHDVVPDVGGEPRGHLDFTKDGSQLGARS